MAIVKLTAAKSSGGISQTIPTVPIQPPVRSPSPDDLRVRSEALVPSTLNLIPIDIPQFDKLDSILNICASYNWSRPEDVIDANYDQVAADLAALTFHVIDTSPATSDTGPPMSR